MDKSIAQSANIATDNLKNIESFMKRFNPGALLKVSNAYKAKGISVSVVFQYLFSMVFAHLSMYSDMKSHKLGSGFGKDCVYRFLNLSCINWIRFTILLSQKIISSVFIPAKSGDGSDASLVVDDSVFSRDRSKKVELPAKVYDHAHNLYLKGFRMLSLGWTNGISFMPLASILLSSENKINRYIEAVSMDRRTNGYKRRMLAQMKGTDAMIELLKEAKKLGIKAKDVLFDSWFASPETLIAVKREGYDVIAMIKKHPKYFYGYGKGTDKLTLMEIYKRNKKRRAVKPTRQSLNAMIGNPGRGDLLWQHGMITKGT